MKLQVAGALLLVSFGALAAGCGTGVYGSAVDLTGPPSAALPSSRSLVQHVQWTRGTKTLDARVLIARHPVKGAKYRFVVWVRGSRNIAGHRLGIGLFGITVRKARVKPGWHQYSVTGRAPSTDALEGNVYVPAWTTVPHSWIDVGGGIGMKVSQ